jgi:hypothetical protein
MHPPNAVPALAVDYSQMVATERVLKVSASIPITHYTAFQSNRT